MKRHSQRLLFGWLSLVVATPVVAQDDPSSAVAEMRRSGLIPGRFVRVERINGYAIEVNEGLKIGISENEIRRVRTQDEKMRAYREQLAKMKDDAETHYLMHRWCSRQGLYDQMQRHLERCIELEPNHSEARAALGYTRYENRWIKNDSLRRSRGMIRDGGKWRFAEEVIQLERADATEKARLDAKKNIASLKRLAQRDTPAGRQARADLANIDDPAADLAVMTEFTAAVESGSVPDQLFWLETLARLNTPVCRDTIIQASMDAPSQRVRERCYELLQGEHKYRAIAYYLSYLSSQDNDEVNRAGRALSYLNDPEIALDLIRALNTEHSIIVQPGGGMNAGMQGGGVGSFTAGGNKPVRITKQLDNPEVLSALLEVVPDDVNYQYNEVEWLKYYALQKAPPPGDLRRDP